MLMKTSISIPDDLFKGVNDLSAETHLSRSQIFADAVRAYLDQRKNEKMLRAINAVYSSVETEEETAVRERARKRYVGIVKRTPW